MKTSFLLNVKRMPFLWVSHSVDFASIECKTNVISLGLVSHEPAMLSWSEISYLSENTMECDTRLARAGNDDRLVVVTALHPGDFWIGLCWVAEVKV